MFNLFSTNPAVALLKDDHARVKALFDRFEAAKSRAAKRKIVRAALAELKCMPQSRRNSSTWISSLRSESWNTWMACLAVQ